MLSNLRIVLVSCLAVALASVLLVSPATANADDFGKVKVGSTTMKNPVMVDLEGLGMGKTVKVNGKSAWPLRQVILAAQALDSSIDMSSFIDKVTVFAPGGTRRPVDPFLLESKANDKKLPLFYIEDEEVFFLYDGKSRPYAAGIIPEVALPASKPKIQVTIDPSRPFRVEAGDSQTFKASASSEKCRTLSVSWFVMLDNTLQTSSSGESFRFKFKKDGEYQILVTVADPESACEEGDASVTVTVGKAKKKEEKKPKKESNGNTGGGSGGGYDSGYGGYYDGSGTGTGTPSTGNPSPPVNKPEKNEPAPVNNNLETVTGQIIDPSQIATFVPSTGGDAESTQPEASEDEGGSSGWGGLSDGAMTALGIGALLGLGGLAEAGAFAGMRRFRFRL